MSDSSASQRSVLRSLGNESQPIEEERFENLKSLFETEEISIGTRNVRVGDHLVFPRRLYKHHALCTKAPVDGNVIEITEYTYSDPCSVGKGLLLCDLERLGKVRTRTVSYQELARQQVVKLKCLEEFPVFSNKETVERAKSRVGENSYNLQCNNCEHFVWWCKYGLSVSLQLQNEFKKWALNIAKHVYDVGKAAGKKLAVEGSHFLTNPYLVKAVANVSDEVAGFVSANATSVGFVIGGAIEVVWTANEIYKANDMRKRGVITTEQFVEETAAVCVKSTCRVGGGVAGSVIGSGLGPVGSLAGGAIGATGGHYVGTSLVKFLKKQIKRKKVNWSLESRYK